MDSKLPSQDNKRELRMANPLYGGKYSIAENESPIWKTKEDSEDNWNSNYSGKDWVDKVTSEHFRREFSNSSLRATLHHNNTGGILGRQQDSNLSSEYESPKPIKKDIKCKGRIILAIIISCVLVVGSVVTVICILLNQTNNDKKQYEFVKAEGKISIQQAFIKELHNKSSDTYLNFTREFVKETTNTLKHHGLQGLQNCTVTDVRNGSIIVEFDLFLEIVVNSLSTSTLKTVFMESFVKKENGCLYFGKYHVLTSSYSISIVLPSPISTTNIKAYKTSNIPSINFTLSPNPTKEKFSDSVQPVVNSLSTKAHTIPHTNVNVSTTKTYKSTTKQEITDLPKSTMPFTNTTVLKPSKEQTTTISYRTTMLKTHNTTTIATLTTTPNTSANVIPELYKTTTIMKTPDAFSSSADFTTTSILKTSGVTKTLTSNVTSNATSTARKTTSELKTINVTSTTTPYTTTMILKSPSVTATINKTTTTSKTPSSTLALHTTTDVLNTSKTSTLYNTTTKLMKTINLSTVRDKTTKTLKTSSFTSTLRTTMELSNTPNAVTLPNTNTTVLKTPHASTVRDDTTTTLKTSRVPITSITDITKTLDFATTSFPEYTTISTTNSSLTSTMLTSSAISNPKTTLSESPSLPEELSTNFEQITTKISFSSKKESTTKAFTTPTIINPFSPTIAPNTGNRSPSTMTTSRLSSSTSLTVTMEKSATLAAITTTKYSPALSASTNKTITVGSSSPITWSSTVSTNTSPNKPTFSTVTRALSTSQSQSTKPSASNTSTSIPTTILTPPPPLPTGIPKLKTKTDASNKNAITYPIADITLAKNTQSNAV